MLLFFADLPHVKIALATFPMYILPLSYFSPLHIPLLYIIYSPYVQPLHTLLCSPCHIQPPLSLPHSNHPLPLLGRAQHNLWWVGWHFQQICYISFHRDAKKEHLFKHCSHNKDKSSKKELFLNKFVLISTPIYLYVSIVIGQSQGFKGLSYQFEFRQKWYGW
jgi:hypothetical protein